ncbi:helix-turn-helix domain-containing protein [Peribacillus sp. SCS-37]|uniref:helix-turn-helix domain-containing protein n=1 Tax=Paraperibacillus esterisolvens TaxID=3115296 RepID=UPI003905BB55
MDFSLIGQGIRDARMHLGISQKELCRDICSQAQISKIEKGEVYPSAITLYLLSKRLGLDLAYFFEAGVNERQDYVEEVRKLLRTARRDQNYAEVREIVLAELDNPIFTSRKENMQLLLWHKGIYEFHVEDQAEQAIQSLEEALALTHSHDNVWTETELSIIIAIGIIYKHSKQIAKALEVFERTESYVKNRLNIENYTLIPKLQYNYSNALSIAGRYEEAIGRCEEAVDWLIGRDCMYLLGEFLYNIGYNNVMLGNQEKALTFYEKAVFIFEIQKDTKHVPYIQDKINKLKEIRST